MFDAADMQKAKQYRLENRYTTTGPDGHTKVNFPLSVSIERLSEYGVGVYLYLSFIKHMAICFFLMGLFQLPALYYNYFEGVDPDEENVPFSTRLMRLLLSYEKRRLATVLPLNLMSKATKLMRPWAPMDFS